MSSGWVLIPEKFSSPSHRLKPKMQHNQRENLKDNNQDKRSGVMAGRPVTPEKNINCKNTGYKGEFRVHSFR